MALALLLFDAAGAAGYLLTIYWGLAAAGRFVTTASPLDRHILLAIPTLVFVLFGQSMSMFYFIGMGKQAREAADAISAEAGERMRSLVRAQKRPIFTPATMAVFAAIAVFVLGGAVHTGVLSTGWHSALAAIALFFHLRATWAVLVGMADLHEWLAAPGGPAEVAEAEPRPSSQR